MLLLQRVMVKTIFLFVIECSSLLHNFETFRKHTEDSKTHTPDLVEFSEVMDLEQVNLGYSTKNILIPSVRDYCQTLIGKTRSFIRRMQWDAYFFLNPDAKCDTKQKYGFKSPKFPPKPIKELSDFEVNIIRIIENVEFHNGKGGVTSFQKQLKNDFKNFSVILNS